MRTLRDFLSHSTHLAGFDPVPGLPWWPFQWASSEEGHFALNACWPSAVATASAALVTGPVLAFNAPMRTFMLKTAVAQLTLVHGLYCAAAVFSRVVPRAIVAPPLTGLCTLL